MSEIKFDYGIQSHLPAQPESPAALGPKFLDTVDALSRIDPETFHKLDDTGYPRRRVAHRGGGAVRRRGGYRKNRNILTRGSPVPYRGDRRE